MFIAWQTFEGQKITVHSIKGAITLCQICFVTERFFQDPLENYFGQQAAISASKDKQSIRYFRFNDNYRSQKIFRLITGNVCERDIDMVNFNNEALPCSKKTKKD